MTTKTVFKDAVTGAALSEQEANRVFDEYAAAHAVEGAWNLADEVSAMLDDRCYGGYVTGEAITLRIDIYDEEEDA